MKWLILLLSMFTLANACSVSHEDVWSCAIRRGATYGKQCVTAADIHRAVSRETNVLTRSMMFVAEGSSYSELFKDCDEGNDGCITFDEAQSQSETCERSCVWKTFFVYILGCTP